MGAVKDKEYKSIRVPAWVYNNWGKAENALAKKGLDALPEKILAPQKCPVCNSNLKSVNLKYEYLSCPKCNYTQQNFSTSSNFLGGVLLGLGIAVLLDALSKEK